MSITETLAGGLGEWRAASSAGGGTALTATAARIALPLGTKQVQLIPRNYSTAVVVKFNVNPWLVILKTTDLLATLANRTDYSLNAQDSVASTKVTLNSFDTIANNNALYVGSYVPFGGVDVTVGNTNSNASVLTVKYWNGAWTNITATDGTASAGASFAQNGLVTWTVPTDWVAVDLQTAETATAIKGDGVLREPQFWTRWEVSAAFDSTTDASAMLAINRSTAYAEIPSGFTEEFAVTTGRGGIVSITALTDAGTANLVVNCSTRSIGRFV